MAFSCCLILHENETLEEDNGDEGFLELMDGLCGWEASATEQCTCKRLVEKGTSVMNPYFCLRA